MTPECAKRVQQKLTETYPSWSNEQGRAIYRAFRSLPDEDYEAAVDCHIMDTKEGRTPPTPADIRYQAEEYAKSRTRFFQDEQRQRDRASFVALLPQRGPLADKWVPRVRDAIHQTSELRRRAVSKWGLDLRSPVDMAVIMDTLTDGMKRAEANNELYYDADEYLRMAEKHYEIRQTKLTERQKWLDALSRV